MAAVVRESVLKNDADGPIKVKGGLGNNSYFKNSVYQVLFQITYLFPFNCVLHLIMMPLLLL